MRVYGSQMSPFVRKVLVFAAEKGLAVEHIPCKPHSDHPEFKAASPLGKIPAFRDGDFRLSDSSAICQYLEHRYPMPAMFPSTAEDHGRMIWGETGRPGYGLYDRALGLTYLQGLWEAL